MSRDSTPIDTSMVEDMLRLRYSQRSDDCRDEAVALMVHGMADTSTLDAAQEHLEQCEWCKEAVSVLAGFDALAPLSIRSPKREGIGGRVWHVAAVVLAILGIVAAAFVMYERPPQDEILTVKGRADKLQVAVWRKGQRFIARPLDTLQDDDRLGLFYTSDTGGNLAVFVIDDSGQISPLYPNDRKESAAIDVGQHIPLSDGAVVRSGEGCEWIVAVFSDVPLPLVAIKKALEQAQRTAGTCGLTVDVPNARSIDMLSFRR